MNKQRMWIFLLLAGALVLAGLMLMLHKRAASDVGEIKESLRKKTSEQTAPTQSRVSELSKTALPEEKTSNEKAVAAWESLVSQLVEQKAVPTPEYAKHVKAAFDKLDKADQMDCIHQALNLLPDRQFPSLYEILYDKGEDPDVLDAIFSDALNRPEELKMPLLKALSKDRDHPLFFESARILDVVEPEPEAK
jgi:hypothetical protein